MVLHTKRLTLRPFQHEDAPRIVQLLNNRNVSDYMRDGIPYPYNLNHARGFIAQVAEPAEVLVRAILYEDQIIGAVGAHPEADIYRLRAELGYYIGEPYWGKGFAQEAVQALSNAALKHYNLHYLEAKVYSNNPSSVHVLKKCGYAPVAYLPNSLVKNGVLLGEHQLRLYNPNSQWGTWAEGFA